MGQEISRNAAKESFKTTLQLPLHDPSEKNDNKKIHSFLSVVSTLLSTFYYKFIVIIWTQFFNSYS